MFKKKMVLLFVGLVLTGCASIKEKKELNEYKCDEIANQLMDLRSMAIESSLMSLSFALNYSGVPKEAILALLEKTGSEEATVFLDSTYRDLLNGLTLNIMEKSGCSIKLWLEQKEKTLKDHEKQTDVDKLKTSFDIKL